MPTLQEDGIPHANGRGVYSAIFMLFCECSHTALFESEPGGPRVAHPVNLLIIKNLHERVAHPAFFWRGGGFRHNSPHEHIGFLIAEVDPELGKKLQPGPGAPSFSLFWKRVR